MPTQFVHFFITTNTTIKETILFHVRLLPLCSRNFFPRLLPLLLHTTDERDQASCLFRVLLKRGCVVDSMKNWRLVEALLPGRLCGVLVSKAYQSPEEKDILYSLTNRWFLIKRQEMGFSLHLHLFIVINKCIYIGFHVMFWCMYAIYNAQIIASL